MSNLLTIGEVARRSGVAASALRFYEERGLLASERAGSGHRRYLRGRRSGGSRSSSSPSGSGLLDEIGAELAKLPLERAPTGRDWSRLARTDVADRSANRRARAAESRAHRMHRLRLSLARPRSRLANPGDRAARLGPGPRAWIGDGAAV